MTSRTSVILLIAVVLTIPGWCNAAGSDKDKDGVPIVDLHGIIVQPSKEDAAEYERKMGLKMNGKRLVTVGKDQMSLGDFVRSYCQDKDLNSTCVRAKKIIMMDASRGPVANLPKGL